MRAAERINCGHCSIDFRGGTRVLTHAARIDYRAAIDRPIDVGKLFGSGARSGGACARVCRRFPTQFGREQRLIQVEDPDVSRPNEVPLENSAELGRRAAMNESFDLKGGRPELLCVLHRGPVGSADEMVNHGWPCRSCTACTLEDPNQGYVRRQPIYSGGSSLLPRTYDEGFADGYGAL